MNKLEKFVLVILVYCLMIMSGLLFVIEFLRIHEIKSLLYVFIIMFLAYTLTLIEEQ